MRRGHRLDFACGQGAVIDSHIIDPALEELASTFVRADIGRGVAACIDRPAGLGASADFLTVCVEFYRLAVKRHADQVPFPVEQLGRRERYAMFDELPIDRKSVV